MNQETESGLAGLHGELAQVLPASEPVKLWPEPAATVQPADPPLVPWELEGPEEESGIESVNIGG